MVRPEGQLALKFPPRVSIGEMYKPYYKIGWASQRGKPLCKWESQRAAALPWWEAQRG